MIDIRHYLIDQAGKDWADLLFGYAGILPAAVTLWMVNRFGDLIIVFEDGSVHLLDNGSRVINRLASTHDEFIQLIDEGDNAENWLMISVVDRCVRAGLRNQCYGFKMPAILGGNYELANIIPTD